MAAAPKYRWVIPQGATATLTCVLKDSEGNPETVLLTGATAELQVRPSRRDATILLEASTTDGRIVITPEVARVAVTIPDDVTELLDFDEGEFDLEVTYSDSTKERILQGKAVLDREVTRTEVPE